MGEAREYRIHIYIYTNIHIHIHTYTYTHIHTYTYTHIHIYTCTYVHGIQEKAGLAFPPFSHSARPSRTSWPTRSHNQTVHSLYVMSYVYVLIYFWQTPLLLRLAAVRCSSSELGTAGYRLRHTYCYYYHYINYYYYECLIYIYIYIYTYTHTYIHIIHIYTYIYIYIYTHIHT